MKLQSLLTELTSNFQPQIVELTQFALDNKKNSQSIVETIERHLTTVHRYAKLPVLYLIDSIVRNVGQGYPNLFTQNIVSTFCRVFEKMDKKAKQEMFKLRQTWNDVFPDEELYAIDVRCQQHDHNWPISAPQPSNTSSVHANPEFINIAQPAKVATTTAKLTEVVTSSELSGVQISVYLPQKSEEILQPQQETIRLVLLRTEPTLRSERFEKLKKFLNPRDTDSEEEESRNPFVNQSLIKNPFLTHWEPPIRMGEQSAPSSFPDPRGPNPFEEALDHCNPHPPDPRDAGTMVERSMFKGPGRRRGGLPPPRGGPGRGAQNMPLTQPLFPESEFPRGLQKPGELVANPFYNKYRNDVKEEQQTNNAIAAEAGSSSSEDMPEQQPSSSALPDVSSLLALAEQCGLFGFNKSEKEPEENGEKKDDIKEPEPITVHENNNNNNAEESTIWVKVKSQQFLRTNKNRSNNNNRKQFAPTPKVTPPPLPTVDVLLVSGDKKYFEERREDLINQLWIGMQCATCGLRFYPGQAIQYSQHLDWHFRKNRTEKEKKNAKKAQSRAWFCVLSEWIQLEEVEDVEDRAASVFEFETHRSASASITQTVTEQRSILAFGHDGAKCIHCGEHLKSYFDQDEEEWRLNDAVLDATYDGEVYHVVCHKEYLEQGENNATDEGQQTPLVSSDSSSSSDPSSSSSCSDSSSSSTDSSSSDDNSDSDNLSLD